MTKKTGVVMRVTPETYAAAKRLQSRLSQKGLQISLSKALELKVKSVKINITKPELHKPGRRRREDLFEL